MISALSHRDDFVLLQRSGSTRRSGPLRARVVVGDGPIDSIHLGFTIGRKFGNAVKRNRMRRRLRHCVREAASRADVETSHVLMGATPAALLASHPELVDHCCRLIGTVEP